MNFKKNKKIINIQNKLYQCFTIFFQKKLKKYLLE